MTHVINARNVNDAFYTGLKYLKETGTVEKTRGGDCLVAPGPVITIYSHPWERILWDPIRDANPVFHLMESLWMLSGSRDGTWLLPFNSGFKNYLEDDGGQHGAYGHRWRRHFGVDQIRETMRILKGSPESRQAVMGMWDPTYDLGAKKKDLPCNTHIYFDCRGGKLNMTVCCRSNDMLWGAYGANAVHMSILQEVMAHGIGVPQGEYRQMSNNFHLYVDNPMVQTFLANDPVECDYGLQEYEPLIQPHETMGQFLQDCSNILLGNVHFVTTFFRKIAGPLRQAYNLRKAGIDISYLGDDEWRSAFRLWAHRRDK